MTGMYQIIKIKKELFLLLSVYLQSNKEKSNYDTRVKNQKLSFF